MKTYSNSQWDSWFESLAVNDYVIIDNFLGADLLQLVKDEFVILEQKGCFGQAAIGSKNEQKVIQEIRSDLIYWINKNDGILQSKLHDLFLALKNLINKHCFLSLSDFEFHFAKYPKGSFYKKHLDQFDSRSNRMISVILYLNKDWKEGYGGELKIYPTNEEPNTIAPLQNRLVMFKSDALPHEVLVSNFERKSITGWMLHQPAKLYTIVGK